MKKYLYPLFYLLSLLFSITSCKEDVNLIGDFKETAIVYGLLNQSETTHLIKINRAFIGPGNALEIAKIPDSSYFSSVDATINEYVGENKTKSWLLKDTTVNNKSENGIFYAPTEKLYYFSGALNPDATYKLEIILYKGTSKEFTVTGETKLVSGITSNQNSYSSFEFVKSDGSLLNPKIGQVSPGNAAIINASLQIFFSEYQDNILLNNIEYTWNTGESQISNGNSFSTTLSGQLFYEIIRDNVTKNPSINKRKLDSLNIILTGGSTEFNDYINANKPSSSLAQSKPNYTNLKVTEGGNVVGLFSSRFTKTISLNYFNSYPVSSCLSTESRKYLCTGGITGNLFFCSSHILDASKSFHCP